jgi:succinyl-diaminopimelate desuccinylase
VSEENLGQRLAKLASDMIKIDTSNPPGNTREFVNFLVDYLQLQGFTPDTVELEEGKPNLLVKVGSGSPTLILNGHMDVVPAGDEDKWTEAKPFSGEIKEGRVYGRGATDMKGGLAVITALFSDVAKLIEDRGAGSLMLVASADEEVGGEKGLGGLVRSGLVKGNAAIIAEPSGVDTISMGEKGLCQLRLVVKGRSAHGSMPILGDNAILKAGDALEIVSQVIGIYNSKLELPKELEELLNSSVDVLVDEANKRQLKISREEAEYVLKRVTFNPGVMRCGTKVNVVPDRCDIEVDLRLPPGVKHNGSHSACDALAEMVLDSLEVNLHSQDFEIKVIGSSEPNFTDPNSDIVKVVAQAVEKVVGARPRYRIETGATDGRYLRYAGVPTVVYGPGEPFLAHSYNEYVKVKDLEIAYRALYDAVLAYFKVS